MNVLTREALDELSLSKKQRMQERKVRTFFFFRICFRTFFQKSEDRALDKAVDYAAACKHCTCTYCLYEVFFCFRGRREGLLSRKGYVYS